MPPVGFPAGGFLHGDTYESRQCKLGYTIIKQGKGAGNMAVININRNQFEEMVHSGKTVLVEFSAPWCVYCRRLAPALESVAEEYKDTLVFTAVNIDDEPELAEAAAIEVVPTLLIYRSGQVLGSVVAPESRAQLVAFIEETLQRQMQEATTVQHIYDMIVVGGGPGGYTAALYAARAGMDTVVLEKLSAGGQMALTEQIDNYPGFEDGIDGFSLGEKMKRGTERFGVETKLTEVLSLELSGSISICWNFGFNYGFGACGFYWL